MLGGSSSGRSWAGRAAGAAFALGASVAVFGAGAQGCLDRPVVPIKPGGSGVIATKIRVTRIDKVDLLLVVDNSASMADKQSELGRRIPLLVKELTAPDIDPVTTKAKFQAIADLHVGVLSSSLGSHGTSACAPSATNEHNNDHGHLMPRTDYAEKNGWVQPTDTGDPSPAACPTPVTASALSWVLDPKKDPSAQFQGPGGATQLQTAAACVVSSVREDGCGYEETWESMYHFLIDPQPYLSAEVKCTFGATGDACGTNKIEVKGQDDEVLKERKAFLRNDSLLAVVVLSDENDFSLKPAQLNWLPWGYGAGQMQRGWKACEGVPDDFEPETGAEYNDLHTKYGCFSCFENTADPGGNCGVPWAKDKLNNDPDGRNERGFHMIQRFGYNFLWSRQRYVDAFKNGTVPGINDKGELVGLPNPIFAGGFRTPDLIVVAGLVGVPLKLVQDPTTGAPKVLGPDDWDKIISGDLKKRDPHMVESIAPRTALGLPKYAGDRSIDPVNGGDRDVLEGDDLQYACIAKRSTVDKGTDCVGPNPEANNPLCATGGTQPYFKAYPGLRHLRILHDLGASGFAASLCNNTYAPAIQGIIDKLQTALNSQCFKSVLNPNAATGEVNCLILESLVGAEVEAGKAKCEDLPGYCTPGAAPCRVTGSNFPPLDPAVAAGQLNLPITVVDAKTGAATQERVQATVDGGNVYAIGSDKVKHLVCEMKQLIGRGVDPATTNSCLKDPAWKMASGDPAGGGWCYTTEPAVVGDACIKIGAPGTIRFEGNTEPKNGSEVFTLCFAGDAPTPTGSTSASVTKAYSEAP